MDEAKQATADSVDNYTPFRKSWTKIHNIPLESTILAIVGPRHFMETALDDVKLRKSPKSTIPLLLLVIMTSLYWSTSTRFFSSNTLRQAYLHSIFLWDGSQKDLKQSLDRTASVHKETVQKLLNIAKDIKAKQQQNS